MNDLGLVESRKFSILALTQNLLFFIIDKIIFVSIFTHTILNIKIEAKKASFLFYARFLVDFGIVYAFATVSICHFDNFLAALHLFLLVKFYYFLKIVSFLLLEIDVSIIL